MSKQYSFTTETDGSFRIADAADNRIGTCFLPENAQKIVDALNATLQCDRCKGTGKLWQDCTLCGDSTFDHNCNDAYVTCGRCGGTGQDRRKHER